MKVLDILSSLKEGQIVTDKRVLATLKRRGLICDYSQWGYLEGARIFKPADDDGYKAGYYAELFPQGNAPKVYKTDCETVSEYDELTGNGDIHYNGYKFTYKYVDGCFKPYLVFVRYTPAFFEVKA